MHLGMNIDTKTMVILVPGKKIRSLRRMAYSLLKKKQVNWTQLARFIGSTMATTRHLLTQLNISRYRQISHINAQMQKELLWWVTELKKWNGRHLLNTLPITQVFTDASGQGYGIVTEHKSIQETLPIYISSISSPFITMYRQYFGDSIYQKVRRDKVYSSEQDSSRYMELLFLQLNISVNATCSIQNESSGCTVPSIEETDRMVITGSMLSQDRSEVGSTPNGPICLSLETPSISIRDMELSSRIPMGEHIQQSMAQNTRKTLSSPPWNLIMPSLRILL
ncbi:hypothetical protein BY458DRAFT_590837 [Sporodiniella umbellata]|nr:hypothetical protein BY458DRAFT_590837 [Sporodiniella umbellata]